MRQLRFLLISLFLSLALTACSGSDGAAGARGAAGTNGTNGTDGIDGKDGTNGTNGTNGTDGVDGVGAAGKDGIAGKDGTNGVDGTDGVDGVDGVDGKDGIDGVTTINYIFADTEFTHDVEDVNSIATGSATPANPVIPDDGDGDDDTQYQSFTALADAAKLGGATDTIDVTLQGFAVLLNDTKIYKRTDSSIDWDNGNNAKGLKINNQTQLSRPVSQRFSSAYAPAVTLRFDNQGAMSAVTAYADKAYNTITVDRSTIFGYKNDSATMAYIIWNESQAADFTDTTPTATEINGIMLVGFETQDTDLPNVTDDITFTGEGAGVYSVFGADSLATNYNTSFTATATVDFTNRTAIFSTSNTACSDENCTLPNANLNLSTGNLSFTDNHISTDILAGSLSGKLDARFYGADAWEFGGTFALSNDSDSIYYGAFGGIRTGIKYDRIFISHIDEAIPVTHEQIISNYASIDVAFNDSHINPATITMNALAVYGDSRTDYARTANIDNLAKGDITPSNSITHLAGAAASITFMTVIDAVTLYLDDGAIYTATGSGGPNDFLSVDIDKGGNGAPDTATTATLNLHRGSSDITIFGYTSIHIAYIDWNISKSGTDLTATNKNLIDSNYDIAGMMVTGVETADSNIPTTGTVTFNGAGRGYVDFSDDTLSRKGVTFTMTAIADFDNTEVTLTSTDSMECDTDFTSSCSSQSKYNFQTANPINYTDPTDSTIKNNISGAITNSDADGYKGMADARFYGRGARDGGEIAGSFATHDKENNHYYGIFGTCDTAKLGSNCPSP